MFFKKITLICWWAIQINKLLDDAGDFYINSYLHFSDDGRFAFTWMNNSEKGIYVVTYRRVIIQVTYIYMEL